MTPIDELLIHLGAEAAKLRQWLSENDVPEALTHAKKITARVKRAHLRRLERWTNAIKDLVQKDAKPTHTLSADGEKWEEVARG